MFQFGAVYTAADGMADIPRSPYLFHANLQYFFENSGLYAKIFSLGKPQLPFYGLRACILYKNSIILK